MNSLSRFLRKFEKSKTLRLFMPGHQGKCVFLNKNFSPKLDITEIKNADSLYESNGVIKNLEEKILNFTIQPAIFQQEGVVY